MQYVFYGPNFRPAYLLYSDIFRLGNVRFYKSPYRILMRKSGCGNGFERYANGLLRKFKNPKAMRNKLFIIPDISAEDRACFVFHNPWVTHCIESGYLEVLRNRFPRAMLIANFLDAQLAKQIDIGTVKAHYDAAYIYDEAEAVVLGIGYEPPPYSKLHDLNSIDEPEYDVSWIGVAKGRLNRLIEVYDSLDRRGVKCHFYVVGARRKDRVERPGIVYAKRFLSDADSFEYTRTSRCLLEIGLPKTDALTSRVREAIVYNKKILSDNPRLAHMPYYAPDMVQIFEDTGSIDVGFFFTNVRGYSYSGDFSPVHMLERLERDYESIMQS